MELHRPCPLCETPLQVLEEQINQAIQCPICKTHLALGIDDGGSARFREIEDPVYALPAVVPTGPVDHSTCYNCGSRVDPVVRSEMSQAGLIVLVMMILLCFPLFWIGLLMKDYFRVCPQCGVRRG